MAETINVTIRLDREVRENAEKRLWSQGQRSQRQNHCFWPVQA
jgi:hypothetical protein